MFDKYYTSPSSNHHSINATITEKRAPTDESIRLLREMEQKVKNEILNSIKLDNNIFRGESMLMLDHLSFNKKLGIAYELNGQRHICEISLSEWWDQDKKIEMIIEELGKNIGKNILQKVLTNDIMSQIFKPNR